ncbi:MAG: phosphoribosyltransferase [Solirubrobacteraceae bacterium]
MGPRYLDRDDAGRTLARAVAREVDGPSVVLGLARGGVPVAVPVARALNAPLEALVVRKLGAPGHEELAVGAIAPGGVRVLNHELVRDLGVNDARLADVEARERAELERRERLYRGGRPSVLDGTLGDRTAVLVDDGMATGATMRVAIAAVRRATPSRIVVAIPVAAPDVAAAVAGAVDAFVCPHLPRRLVAVGAHYVEFGQTSDDEVIAALAGTPAT